MANQYQVKPWLWQFALDTIQLFNIDASHGLQHFINTLQYARLIRQDYKLSDVDIEVIEDAAFSHDCLDGKYMSESEGLARFKQVFLQNGYELDKLEQVVYIVTHISFSKRIKRQKLGLPMIEEGPWKLATMIVCDADQLDGYDVDRCRIYQETKHQHLEEPERSRLVKGWRKTILVKRVLLYKTKYLNTDIAKQLAEPLHDKVLQHVKDELEAAEIFEY